METVADVLDRKYPQFNTVSPDCKVSDALYQMSCENVDHLIVIEEEKFMGLLTDHDIASKVLFAESPLNKIQVREFMNRTLPVAAIDDSIEYCMQMMERFHAKHLAVFDSFDFKGVVCAHDLLEEALNKRKATFSGNKILRQGYPWNY
jgi:predicted transcriptional regulator